MCFSCGHRKALFSAKTLAIQAANCRNRPTVGVKKELMLLRRCYNTQDRAIQARNLWNFVCRESCEHCSFYSHFAHSKSLAATKDMKRQGLRHSVWLGPWSLPEEKCASSVPWPHVHSLRESGSYRCPTLARSEEYCSETRNRPILIVLFPSFRRNPRRHHKM